MKPINLKIKGLNSFIEEQEIDFERLMEKGLFGIFGDTGSGKSTILDGITLALYGSIARNTTKYINANCTSAKVSFKFQISGKESKIYVVDRQYRKDKTTGSARVNNAKIVQIIGDKIEVLAEGSTNVTKACEDIIGLKIDDFTRTVVLPQGKFSEFLKLEGKSRREMLERLFNLQKYGDDLSRKLAKEINQNKNEENILIGELKGYEDINKEILDENKEKLNTKIKELKICKEKQDKISKNFIESQGIWNLQNELEENNKLYNKLKGQEKNINEKKEKIKLGESANKVTPYINRYEEIISEIKINKTNLDKSTKNLKIVSESKNLIEKKFDELRIEKEEKLPEYKIKQTKVLDAIKEKENLDILVKEINDLEESYAKLNASLKEKMVQQDVLYKNRQDINIAIRKKEQDSELLKVDVDYKNKVSEGLSIYKDCKNLLKRKDKLEGNFAELKKAIDLNKEKHDMIKENLDKSDKAVQELKERLKEVELNCPGSEKELSRLKEVQIKGEQKWNDFNELNKNIDENKSAIKKLTAKIINEKEEKSILENKIDGLRKEKKLLETENIAHSLREKLLLGEVCPVCGSKEHYFENIEVIDSSKLNSSNEKLLETEKVLKLLDESLTKNKTNLENEEEKRKNNLEEIGKLGENFKKVTIIELADEYVAFEKKYNEYNENKLNINEKKEAETELKNQLDVEFSSVKTSLDEYEKQEKVFIKEQIVLAEEMSLKEINLNLIKKELKIEDFEGKSKEILSKEIEKNKLENEIKESRKKLENFDNNKEKLDKEISKLKEEIAEQNTSINEKEKNKKEKVTSISNKVGEEKDLTALSKKIDEAIRKIEFEFKEAEKENNDIEIKYQKLNSAIEKIKGILESLQKREKASHEELEAILKKENFKDIEDVNKYFLDEDTIDFYKKELEKYSNDLSKLQGAIDNINKKLDGKRILKEKWEEIQSEKESIDMEVEKLNEEKISQDACVKNIEKQYVESLVLFEKKQKLDYKLALLADLDKLFKGKRFIEYVAANQLKYISIEASKILKDITSGNYALEVDENARFIIRDYKNGGAGRDASTLSGGETFLSSLALALALSSQIQLKGRAPLELFFLDEGFGTLDNNLLELVMESLEKIHNDKLKIGIISHVESIKNRVPVKILLTPAESGKGGSKVKLEIS